MRLHRQGMLVMNRTSAMPISLKIVATILVLSGAFALMGSLFSLTTQHIELNFLSFNLLIGFGLISLKSGWRISALVSTWFCLIVCVVSAFTMILALSAGKLPLLGLVQTSAFVVFYSSYLLWQLRVLNSAHVRALFNRPASTFQFGENRAGAHPAFRL